ncbi:unnamed protein product, partial [marine sediment metagenome]
MLLSRFDLTISQAKRWFDTKKRNRATPYVISDSEILENPYVMVEADLGEPDDSPISMGSIDRGLMPESIISASHPVPQPSYIGSPNDARRVRAGIVSVLQYTADQGDSLLSQEETLEKLEQLPLARELTVGEDWIDANQDILAGVVETLNVIPDPEEGKTIAALQLREYKDREDYLRKVMIARAKKTIPSLGVDWKDLLIQAIEEVGGEVEK